MALLAFAAERRAAAPLLLWALAAIDRYLLPAGLTAANPPHAPAVAQDGTDRRTDRHRIVTQTLLHTMRAVSIIDRLIRSIIERRRSE